MTALGARKHDNRGRSTGQRKTNKRTRIIEQFSPRPIAMMESPAYRVFNGSEHKVLSRLEIELAHHGGDDNGKLPCTFNDFQAYGVHRNSIAPALRTLQALGFIEVTQEGRAGNGEHRQAHKFRLTFRHCGAAAPTNEWERIATAEEAEAVAAEARKKKSPVSVSDAHRYRKAYQNGAAPVSKAVLQGTVRKTILLSRVSGRNASAPSTPPSSAAPSIAAALPVKGDHPSFKTALHFAFDGDPGLIALVDRLSPDIIIEAVRLLDLQGPQAAADWLKQEALQP